MRFWASTSSANIRRCRAHRRLAGVLARRSQAASASPRHLFGRCRRRWRQKLRADGGVPESRRGRRCALARLSFRAAPRRRPSCGLEHVPYATAQPGARLPGPRRQTTSTSWRGGAARRGCRGAEDFLFIQIVPGIVVLWRSHGAAGAAGSAAGAGDIETHPGRGIRAACACGKSDASGVRRRAALAVRRGCAKARRSPRGTSGGGRGVAHRRWTSGLPQAAGDRGVEWYGRVVGGRPGDCGWYSFVTLAWW